MIRKSGICLAAVVFLSGCDASIAPPAPVTQIPGVPPNLSYAKETVRKYHDSGRYDRDVRRLVSGAREWIRWEAPRVQHPAVVLDIDETSLSNWDEMRANDFGYLPHGACDRLPEGPCGMDSWEASNRSPALKPMLELYREARKLGVAMFFVTGRREHERAATSANLTAAGYEGWSGLYLKPDGMRVSSAASYKAPVRAEIEAKGYRVIASIGDQMSDLEGGHAEQIFLVPNPFYFIP
ncbi:acid phosphatase [Acetobacter sp. AN02]|uniref:HAD family acid phosphatase n=1 Tax=Acetobacter sp. AN02 TaxID=2894186 RepID=UPI00243427FD|nr:HAD family acid phosphatase [Acetobacter sp. AN02]MDG6093880.1 acid phosphatase [Acetobacter sp. AN02]